MTAIAQLAQEQSSPRTVGLARVINNSVALVLLDLLNKAIPLIVFPRVVRALGPVAYGRLGFAAAVAGFEGVEKITEHFENKDEAEKTDQQS